MPNTGCEFKAGNQVFNGKAQFIAGDAIGANVVFISTTAAEIFATDTLFPGVLDDTTIHFRLIAGGLISSDGSDDLTLLLRWNATTILTITTTALPNEDDKAWHLDICGRLHTVGASGKVVASGVFANAGTGMADIIVSTAAVGVALDTTVAGDFNLYADWDDDNADTDLTLLHCLMTFYTG